MLASLDVARMQMATEGRLLIEQAIDLAEWTRQEINSIPGLTCFGQEKLTAPGVFALDPTKLTVTVKGLGFKGAEAERILRSKYSIQAELSDMFNLLFLITIGDKEEDVRHLVESLRDLAANHVGPGDFASVHSLDLHYPLTPEQVLSPREALFGNTRKVSFQESVGQVCAEIVTFYPPGIPLLCPGERISRDVADYCLRLQDAGLHISGPEDYTLETIKVVE
jgi:lysine decarboxylase